MLRPGKSIMHDTDPLSKSKDAYGRIIDKIKSDSSVGIDAQLTHALIIQYLINIEDKIRRLEERLDRPKQ